MKKVVAVCLAAVLACPATALPWGYYKPPVVVPPPPPVVAPPPPVVAPPPAPTPAAPAAPEQPAAAGSGKSAFSKAVEIGLAAIAAYVIFCLGAEQADDADKEFLQKWCKRDERWENGPVWPQ